VTPVFHVWDIGPAKIGVMICFDWYYPEAARTLALKGRRHYLSSVESRAAELSRFHASALSRKPGLCCDL
jgi:predicted amidohydrolase